MLDRVGAINLKLKNYINIVIKYRHFIYRHPSNIFFSMLPKISPRKIFQYNLLAKINPREKFA